MEYGDRLMSNQPLRVLQIASTSQMGGAEQMIMHLVRNADPQRLELEVLALMGEGPLPGLAVAAGARAKSWGVRRIWDPRLLLRMRQFLHLGCYDIVHCYGLRAELLTRWVAHGLGVPVISSISSPDPWRKWRHVMLDRLTADGVTAWVAVCEAGRQTRIEREKFPAERIHVVLNGIPDLPPPEEPTRREARKKWQVPEEAPVLSMLANLRAAKGYPDLIEAMVLLKEKYPNVICLCAGRDDSEGAIPALARERGVEGNMRWLGFVTDAQSVLDASDLAVLSSHWEGCPVNLLEAMRAGMASVSTRVGGIPELVESGVQGLLVAPRQPAELAGAIGTLLDDPEGRRRMGLAARARFLERFTVQKMVDELTRIYETYAKRDEA